jgi:hypothetical protein
MKSTFEPFRLWRLWVSSALIPEPVFFVAVLILDFLTTCRWLRQTRVEVHLFHPAKIGRNGIRRRAEQILPRDRASNAAQAVRVHPVAADTIFILGSSAGRRVADRGRRVQLFADPGLVDASSRSAPDRARLSLPATTCSGRSQMGGRQMDTDKSRLEEPRPGAEVILSINAMEVMGRAATLPTTRRSAPRSLP